MTGLTASPRGCCPLPPPLLRPQPPRPPMNHYRLTRHIHLLLPPPPPPPVETPSQLQHPRTLTAVCSSHIRCPTIHGPSHINTYIGTFMPTHALPRSTGLLASAVLRSRLLLGLSHCPVPFFLPSRWLKLAILYPFVLRPTLFSSP